MSDQICIGLATIPERKNNVNQVILSLLNQCDKMVISLNGFEEVPNDFIKDTKIQYIVNKEKLGSEQKFIGCLDWDGYFLTVDDDILYPKDYVQNMVTNLKSFNNKAIVGVHGSIISTTNIKEFYTKRKIIHFESEVKNITPVLYVGAGTACFHTSEFMLDPNECSIKNIDDIYLMLNSLPLPHYIVKRQKQWLKQLPTFGNMIYANNKQKEMTINLMASDYQEQLKERILNSVKLSVSMIVKNETTCLRECLESVKEADEIVIVDTGSEDDTIEIAKEYTDKVYYGEDYLWCDDFSFSRNQSLEKCTGDWILSIDADEVLEKNGIEKIKNAILNCSTPTVSLRVSYKRDPKQYHDFPKVFKNNVGIEWKGRIHNYLSTNETTRTDICTLYGYSDAHKKDPDRALRVLTKVVEENPKAVRERFYLAREYWYRKDYTTAIEKYKEYIAVAYWLPEKADAMLMLARCYWNTNQGSLARKTCLDVIALNPDYKEALLFMAELHYEPWKSKWANLATVATNKDVLFINV